MATLNPSIYHRVKHVVHFFWPHPEVRRVDWVGDVNGWEIGKTPYTRDADGWRLTIELPHGHHRYLVVVDGVPMLDPQSRGTVKDDEGNSFSLIPVS